MNTKDSSPASLAAAHGSGVRVTLEIFHDKWIWSLHRPGMADVTYGMERCSFGASGLQNGDPFDFFPDDLAEAIDDNDPMAIMRWIGKQRPAKHQNDGAQRQNPAEGAP